MLSIQESQFTDARQPFLLSGHEKPDASQLPGMIAAIGASGCTRIEVQGDCMNDDA